MKNNLQLLVLALGILIAIPTLAQKDNVGIGTTKPDQSAMLDINSSNKGLLMPRMSLQQRGSIQNPAEGLVIYQTDFLSGFYFYDGKDWKPMISETNANSVADANNWGISGNAGLSAANFIGTTDAVPLNFKVNGYKSGLISVASTNTHFGYASGNSGGSGTENTGFGWLSLLSYTTGYGNTAYGNQTLQKTTTGQLNLAVGGFSLQNNIGGFGNVGLGYATLINNVSGNNNVAIGADALYSNTTSGNIAIGRSALTTLTTGANNLAIGYQAGNSANGSNNIFLGTQAGFSETGSNKLYITPSNTTQPTIYGDFSANFVSIGNNITLAKRDAIATAGSYGLLVEKGILTEKLKVATIASADWADYVFDEKYKMLSLEEVEKFVKANKHLPNVPSAEEMSKNGLDIVTSDSKLLEKIEELTLYMIEMNKEIKALKAENVKLKK